MPKLLFEPGRIISTSSALDAMEEAGPDHNELLDRHVAGDWGEVTEQVRQENELSVKSFLANKGGKILSVYTLRNGLTIWIRTDLDRSVTSFILPEEGRAAATQVLGPLVVELEAAATGEEGEDEAD